MNRRAQLICAWSGVPLTVLFIVGGVLLGRFIPPWVHPSDNPLEVAAVFTDHAERIRLGALLTILGMTLMAPWGVSIAAQTRRTEGGFPILTYLQIVCVAVATMIVVLMAMFWAVATFRPYDPEIVQFCNDIAYFLFLFTWPPFSVWVITIALSIFLDPSEERVYPRWAAYLNLWVGLLFAPAALIAFVKHGAFSWSGLMALYVPVVVFFIWLITMTVLTIRNVRQGAVYEPDWSSNGAGAVRDLAPAPSPSARPVAHTSR